MSEPRFGGHWILGIVTAAALVLSNAAPADDGFTAEDEAAVRALEETYRAGWLAGEADAVMATLAPDAVLMPAGVEPIVGHVAIRGFWWPDDGSETTIDAYEITVLEVEGSGGLAYLRGRASLEFTFRDPSGEVSELKSRSVHLSIARRGPDGEWRIVRRIWSAIR